MTVTLGGRLKEYSSACVGGNGVDVADARSYPEVRFLSHISVEHVHVQFGAL